jgi:hypothetical protein
MAIIPSDWDVAQMVERMLSMHEAEGIDNPVLHLLLLRAGRWNFNFPTHYTIGPLEDLLNMDHQLIKDMVCRASLW